MRFFLQYHNAARLGWVPLDERPFLQTQLGVYTRRPSVLRALGGAVFLIVGVGRPTRYYLWETFRVDQVEPHGGDYLASGPGWQLVPPVRLEGGEFEEFRRACANFVTFRRVDGLPYCATLAWLAGEGRRPEVNADAERFCTELVGLLPKCKDVPFFRGFVRQRLGDAAGAVADLDEALRRGTEFRAEAEACRRLALRAAAGGG